MEFDLGDWPTPKLLSEAACKRDSTFGDVVTYSPKAFFPLTMLCRDRCGYCTFAKAPARLERAYLTAIEIEELARKARQAGAVEALFTLGEHPEDRYAVARRELEDYGFISTIDYLIQSAGIALESGLLPHINAGTLTFEELKELRKVSVSMGLMIESSAEDLGCHRLAPDKEPRKRFSTLELAGVLGIPMTTGLLVGIGDTEDQRIEALARIAALSRSYGHIQEVIIQNFVPKPRTPMAQASPCDVEEFLRTISLARLILPETVHVQAPPNLFADIGALLGAGIDDLGGISWVTPDHVNPERPWPEIETLEASIDLLGKSLVPRLPVYPEFALDDERWLDPEVNKVVLCRRDQLGYAREHDWYSGQPASLSRTVFPQAPDAKRYPGWLTELVQEVESGIPAPAELLERALSAKGHQAQAVVEFADELRRRAVGEKISFVVNRNVNYTNVCTFRCRFCSFSKGKQSLNLRGTPYLLSFDEILAKVDEARQSGATEVCLQGGIHPRFDGEYYLDVTRAIHATFPDIHIHAFSALEVFTGAKRLGEDLETYLMKLKEAGLKSLPGTAAEILSDRVRAVICPDKLSTEEWLEVHRIAHNVGLKSNVTIMFGSVETVKEVVGHLTLTRDLAIKTSGFTEFVPLPFVHMATPLFLSGRSRMGPTLRETILTHALGRIAYFRVIDNIQASWVKLGVTGASHLLKCGANDLGGTLMEESISHAAGATHGTRLEVEDFKRIAASTGRTLYQRNTFYDHIADY